MQEQLDLFGDENTLYNTAVQNLLEMRFAVAAETLREYSGFFPWAKDVERELQTATFWMERLGVDTWEPSLEDDPEAVYKVWLQFEKAFEYPWGEQRVEHKLQTSVFSRLAAGMEARFFDKRHTLAQGTPMGLFHLRAGDADAAVACLQAHVRAEPENGLVLGYLGDAHILRADREAALTCYQRAFALDPEKVDVEHILCSQLLHELRIFEAEDATRKTGLAWFPVVAQLRGFFRPVVLNGLDQFKYWHILFERFKGYYHMQKDFSKDFLLFFCAMVLSDNAAMVRYVSEPDLIEARKIMKDIDEDLFSWHISRLREKESSSINRL